jgi:hypothetical protein
VIAGAMRLALGRGDLATMAAANFATLLTGKMRLHTAACSLPERHTAQEPFGPDRSPIASKPIFDPAHV